jgi:hypothetical protein
MNGAGQNSDLTAPFDETPFPNHLAGGNHVLVAILVNDDGSWNRIGRATVINQHRPADCMPVGGDRNVRAPNLPRLSLDGFVYAFRKYHMRVPVVGRVSACYGLAARCMSYEQSDSGNKRVTTEHR